jgi:hypothetical protein
MSASFTPSDLQATAIREIKEWFLHRTAEQQVFRVFGYAGSGKTTLTRHAIDELGLDTMTREDGGAGGSESMLKGVQAVVNQRMSEMATKMDATLEHLRIGAIKGQILDADGSAVIYDLFTEFGVTAHTEIDFDLDNASPAAGAVKKKCHDIRRKIEDELGAQPYEHIHAMCGADFFDDLITHSEVAKAHDRYLDGAFLRQGQARGSFEYSGIVLEEYRGRVGTVDFTDASKAYFFPVGVPGLFRQYNAPADFVETANTIGLPRYAKQAADQQFARWVMLHVQSNPLPICTRPRVLIKGKRT